MEPYGAIALGIGTFLAAGLSYHGIRRKALSTAGAVAAFTVGCLHFYTGLRGMNLIVFYFLGTKATKYKQQLKAKMDSTAGEGSVRGAAQVLSCSVLSAIYSQIHFFYCGEERAFDFENNLLASQLSCAILAHHATCLADTLASELGLLAKTSPFLITQPWKSVPPGTNGVRIQNSNMPWIFFCHSSTDFDLSYAFSF